MDIHRTPYVVITEQVGSRTLCVRRTNAPFSTLEEMTSAFTQVNRVLDRHGRARLSLIVDTREAPPRNDPAFEAAFGPLRAQMLSGFRRVAVLVSTPIGKLQVERHAREDGLSVRAFSDEIEALTYCNGR